MVTDNHVPPARCARGESAIVGKRRLRSRALTATALAGGALAMLAAAPAAAQSTRGGQAGGSAPGGISNTTGPGQDGQGMGIGGGSGGGAGATGGSGSSGAAAGGASPGARGGDGTSGIYAGGGGGGAHGAVLVTTTTPVTDITGGRGGDGGSASTGDGGGGGAGGYGVVATTGGSLQFDHAIAGGAGGAGGNGYINGGGGGGGGHGLVLTGGANVMINGEVTGGNGGTRGGHSLGGGGLGAFGAGGYGIVANGIQLTLNASVSGGLSGDGVTRAYALSFSNNNMLFLDPGWSITGGINIAGGSLVIQNGAATPLTSVISGTGSLGVDGAGTLVLAADNNYAGTTTIDGGALQIGNGGTSGTLGAGNVTNQARLIFNRSDDFTVSNAIGGSGAVIKVGAGTLTLTGANTYSGGTTIGAGTLRINAVTAINSGLVTFGGGNLAIYTPIEPISGVFIRQAFGDLGILGDDDNYGFYAASNFIVAGGVENQTAIEREFSLSHVTRFIGGTIIGPVRLSNSGALSFQNGASAGDAAIVVQDPGTLTFDNGDAGSATISNQNEVSFVSGSTAGTASITNQAGFGVTLNFDSGSTAGSATLTNAGTGTTISFSGDSTAGTATINNGVGSLIFNGTASAGGAAIVQSNAVAGPRTMIFNDSSTAGNATITGTAGSINFYDASSAGTASIAVGTGSGLLFQDGSWAAGATLTANGGGTISFRLGSSGGTARLIVESGGTARFSQHSTGTAIGSIEGAGSLNLGEWKLVVGGNGGTSEFSGGISGTTNIDSGNSGRLVKTGSGTLTLSGNNSYTGGTTLDQGGLVLAHDNALGGGAGGLAVAGGTALGYADGITIANAITLNGTADFEVGGTDSATQSGGIVGAGSFTKIGGGTLILSGNNSYSGGTTIAAGLIEFATDNNLGIGNVTLDGGGLRWASGTSADISARLSFGTSGGAFDTNGNDVTLAGDFAGTGGLVKFGEGTLTFGGDNGYSGDTTIVAGTLLQGSANAFGFGGGVILAGGTLDLGAFDLRLSRLFGWVGNVVGSGGALTMVPDESLTLGEDGAALTLGVPLIIGETNTLTLLGNNDLAGSIVLSGRLILGSTGSVAGSNAVIETVGSVITYADGTDEAAAILLNSNDTQLEVLNADIATQSGTISETGGSRPLEKIGTGTLIVSGDNSYSGGTLISDGTLALGHDNGAGSGTITVAGKAALAATGPARTIRNDIISAPDGGAPAMIRTDSAVLNLQGILSGGDFAFVSGTPSDGSVEEVKLESANSYGATRIGPEVDLRLTGAGTLGSGVVDIHALGLLTINRTDGPVEFSNEMTGAGILHLSSSFLTLSGASTRTGATILDAGQLFLGRDDALGSGGLTVSNNGGPASLELNGYDQTVASLDGDGTVTNTAEGLPSVLTVGTGSIADFSFAGVLNDGGSVAALALVKNGAHSFTLSGGNSFAGGTTLNAGVIITESATALGLGGLDQAGGTLDIRAPGLTLASLAGTGGTITTEGGGNFVLTVTGGVTSYAGTIRDGNGAIGVEITTGADLTLTGDNAFTFGLNIADAAVELGSDTAAGGIGNAIYTLGDLATIRFADGIDNASIIELNSGDTQLFVAAGASAEQSGQIFGCYCAGFTKTGDGTLTLSGVNGYIGTTSILGGTLSVTQAAVASSELVEIGNGARLQALEDSIVAGDMTILTSGGTIDSGANGLLVAGAVDFQGTLTKTGSGTLLLIDAYGEGTGDGGINVTAGTLALGSDFAAGSGILNLADGTTLMNAGCDCLDIGNDIQIAAGGTATIDGDGAFTTLSGRISGGNAHFYTDPGTSSSPLASVFELRGANNYGDTLIGANVAVVLTEGTLGSGDVLFEDVPSDPEFPAALVFANTADYSYGGTISGGGLISVETYDPATTIGLTGSNSAAANFTGTIDVLSGRLMIDGDFGDVLNNNATLYLGGCVCADAVLGGSGTFHGNVELGDATLNPGNSPGTLNIAGNLTLGGGTILNFELGAPGVIGGGINDLVNIGGNLTLDGTLNTIDFGPDYGPGYYRLFNYAGGLLDNGLDIGTIAGGLDASVFTNIGGQVNLRLGAAQIVQYWDGADTMGASAAATGNGGAGSWDGPNSNWTAPTGYAVNDIWQSQIGVFAGAAGGTVTVEGTQVFQELRFQTDGYLLRPLDGSARLGTTGGFSILDVDANFIADIGVVIEGAGITKTGGGTLIFSGVNTYSGATDIAAGTLRLGINNALTDPTNLTVSAGATFDLNGFRTHVGSLAGAGDVTLGGGRLDTGYNNSSTSFSGTVTGADGSASVFTKNGSGTLTLSGTIALGNGGGVLSSFSQVNAGTLLISASGSLSADLIQNFSTLDNSGTINVDSTLQTFSTVTNAATGVINGNTQNFGILDNYGTMGTLQSLGGTATNYASGTINGNVQAFASFANTGIINGSLVNFSTAQIENQVNGELANLQTGATVTLTGTVTGITNYNGAQGALFDLASFDTMVGGLNGNGAVELGSATLTVGSIAAFSSFDGVISGSGGLIKTGAGTQTLNGLNTYTGFTSVDGGSLEIGSGGGLVGNVTVASGGTFANAGAVTARVVNEGIFNHSGTLSALIPVALSNDAGGITNASGAITGGIENAGILNVAGTLTGVTNFIQTASGALNLHSNDLTLSRLQGQGAVDLGGGTLTIGAGNLSSNFIGTITGTGGVTKIGTGSLGWYGVSSYTGATTVDGGALTLFATGRIAGEVVNHAALASIGILDGGLTNSGTAQIGGALNGLVQNQSGMITLIAATTGIGRIEQAAGAQFRLGGFNTEIGSLNGAGDVVLGSARLTLGGDDSDSSFAGTITGGGASQLTKTGAGTLTLSGASSYAGATVIAGGTLLLADGGSIAGGDVLNDATLAFDGAVDRTFVNVVQGSGALIKTGTHILTLSGASSYSGGTIVSGGVLALADDNAAGSGTIALAAGTKLRDASAFPGLILGNDIAGAAGGTVTIEGGGGSQTFLSGAIGGGSIAFASAGGSALFVLAGANAYGDTLIGGEVTLGIADGRLGTGNVIFDSAASNPLTLASLVFANSADSSYAGTISGGGLIQLINDPGITTTFTGSNSAAANFTGAILVGGGKLVIDGDFGDVVGNSAQLYLNHGGCGCTVASLGGSGTIHGDVTVINGALDPGNSPGTLTIAGNLNLGAGTILNFELGEAGTVGGANNDLVIVGGNLTLDGTLNVVAQPLFGAGYYRLFNYGGALTDHGLSNGSLPAGYTSTLLTNIAGQVNILFADAPQAIQYWDGADTTGASTATGGDGGAGTWSSGGSNWTAPTGYGVNDAWASQIGVFAGASGGDVTISGTQAFQELRFQTSGYVLAGAAAADGLATSGGFSVIDVDSGVEATVNALVSGAGGLTKTGAGTLGLGGANSYTGVTTASAGTLAVLAGGSIAGAVTNDATLTNDGSIAGPVTNHGALTSTGTLAGGLANSGTAAIAGQLNGAVSNSGTIALTGATAGIGAVTQTAAGSFDLNDFDTSIGSIAGAGAVDLGSAVLTTNGNGGSTSFAGIISGTGGLIKAGAGTLTLTGTSSYTGLTTVSDGTLALGAAATLAGKILNNASLNNAGTIGGAVQNQGSLTSTGVLDGGLVNQGNASIRNQLNGDIVNGGTLALTGTTSGIGTYTGSAGSTFALAGFATTIGGLAGQGSVALGSATLTAGADDSSTSFAGMIAGVGGLTKAGTGTLTLTGASTYGGLTTVSNGTLVVAATGSLAGNVQNAASLVNAGTIGGALVNAATASNSGTIALGVDNSGALTSSGVVGVGVVNRAGGVVEASGQINGFVSNSGIFNLSGALNGITALLLTGQFNLGGFDLTIGSLEGSGSMDFGSGAAALTVGGSDTDTGFAGAITGSGSLAKVGTGTLALSGSNTFTGIAHVTAGTLRNTASGSLAADVVNAGNLVNDGIITGSITNHAVLVSAGTLGDLANNGTAWIQGIVNGAIDNSGGGAIAFTGATTGIGSVTQSAGATIDLGANTIAFAALRGAGEVRVEGALILTGAADSRFDGVISGSGSLVKQGAGIFTLGGANGYSGTTLVSAGTLSIAVGGALASSGVRNEAVFANAGIVAGPLANIAGGSATNSGTLRGGVVNAGSFASTGIVQQGLVNAGTAMLSGQLNGTLQNDAGTVTLSGATTGIALLSQQAGATLNLAGHDLTVGAISGAGAIQLGAATLTTGGDGQNRLFSGAIAGSGGLAKTGAGALVLTGTNSYSGTTNIAAGTVQLGNGGTSGAIGSGAVVGNGTLAVNRSDIVTLANALSGTARFAQIGTGTTTLTGANSYNGGTLVAAGRLRGDTASLQGDIQLDAALEFVQANAGTYAGRLFGTGIMEKVGAGTLSLTGDSASFTGATRLFAGRLNVNGLLSRSVVTVGSGATLGGIGVVGGIVAQSSSVIAPGNSVGTLGVSGNVVFQAGSLFAAEIQPAAADRIQASGTAQLGGTLAITNLGGSYAFNSVYVLLEAQAGRTGVFNITSGLDSFGLSFRPRIVYTATQVQLLLAPNQISAIVGTIPLSANQGSAASRVDAAIVAGYDPRPLEALLNLTPSQMPAGLDALSGEIYASVTRSALEDERLVREAAIGRVREAADRALSGAGGWGQVVGSRGSADSDGNAAAYDTDRTGFLVGIDTGAASEEGSWRAGLIGQHIRTTVAVSGRASRAELEQTGGGFYAGIAASGLQARFGATLTHLELDANRRIAFPGFSDAARGKTRGNMLQSFAELGYRIGIGADSFVEPFVTGSVARVAFDAFQEAGGAAALALREQKRVLGIGIAGVRGEAAVGSEGGTAIRLGGTIGVRHAFGDRDGTPVIALAAAPGQGFAAHSAAIDSYAAVGNLDVTLDVSDSFSVRFGYTGVQGRNAHDHGARATFSLRF